MSRFLAEFEHQRYDEVEVPGQYLQLKDSNADFVKIDRFESTIEIINRHGSAYRRIGIRGSNGSIQKFIVQNPSARQSRREEKILQFFRIIKRYLWIYSINIINFLAIDLSKKTPIPAVEALILLYLLLCPFLLMPV